MIWYCVYVIATGEADSFGSTIADPLPDGLAAILLSEQDTAMIADGTGIWDPATLTVIPRTEES